MTVHYPGFAPLREGERLCEMAVASRRDAILTGGAVCI